MPYRQTRLRPTRRTAAPRTRRGRRPKPRPNKSSRYSIVKRMNYNGFHCFKEKYMFTFRMDTDANGDCANSTAGGTGWGSPVYTNKLNQLGDITNYQNLFEQYRITGIKLKIFPNRTEALTPGESSSPGGTQISETTYWPIPKLWYNYDNNDGVNPPDILTLMERDPKLVMIKDKPISIYIRNPSVLSQGVMQTVASTAPTTSVTTRPLKSPWLNLTADGVNVGHVGLEFGIFGAQPSTTFRLRTVATFYFQCKGNR